MFTVALLKIAKIWQQPKCPSTDERIKKDVVCVYVYKIYTTEYYWAIKKNKFHHLQQHRWIWRVLCFVK